MLQTVDDYIEADLTHSIHTSGRKSFRGCRRRWNWIFNDYWYPRTTAKPLEFGVAFHKGMETLYEPSLWDKPREIVLELAIQTFRTKCIEQRDNYLKQVGPLGPEEIQDYVDRLELGEGMLRYHAEKPMVEYDYGKITPVKVEIPFEVPIEGPDGEQLRCKCRTCQQRYVDYMGEQTPSIIGMQIGRYWKGLPVTYGGRIDALFIDDKGRLWIVDWKSAARLISENDRDEFLQLDDQITSYCWALRKLGIDVAGFIYHEAKKSLLVEPEPLKRRYQGKLYSCNKQNPTTLNLFVGTVSENDTEAYEAGLYDEYITWLEENSTRFHNRIQQHRNATELDQCGFNIWQEAADMVDRNLRIYPNAGRFNCENCAFKVPCVGQNQGEDFLYALETMFDKRKHHYWVTTEPSTDSKAGQ